MNARHSQPKALIDIAVAHLGTMQAVADALQVNHTTVARWRNGESGLRGSGLVALMALIRHPEDFSKYKTN